MSELFTTGVYAPVSNELTLNDLPVSGTIPPEFDGLLVRNGPNPMAGSLRGGGDNIATWFTGDGMLHGVRVKDGKAAWYRNRYVQTQLSAVEHGADITPDPHDSPANTHVIGFAGKVMALCESGWPYQVTNDLDTVGMFNFNNKLVGSMTAHPKIDPFNGQMSFFGYSWEQPYLRYHVASAQGELIHSTTIDVPGATMIHDMAATSTRSLMLDLPVIFDLDLAMAGIQIPYRWDENYGARVGILPRMGNSTDVKWFEIEPCYIFHVFNAYDAGSIVVMDVCRYDKVQIWDPDSNSFSNPANSYLCRYRFDLETGKSTCQQLSDSGVEFPRIDLGRQGVNYRYGYGVSVPDDDLYDISGVTKFDLVNDSQEHYDVDKDHFNGEPVFVPRQNQGSEDDGYLLVVNYDKPSDTSEILFIDAESMTETVAKISLPVRVPMGFHGSWLPWHTVSE